MQSFSRSPIQFIFNRPLDFSYRSNVMIAAFVVMVGAVGCGYGLLMAQSLMTALGQGVQWAASAAIGWILARELDPDHVMTSAIAPIIALGGAILFDWHDHFIAIAVVVVTVRLVNRTTGLAPQQWDAFMYLLAVIVVGATENWVIGVAMAMVFWWDGLLPKPSAYATPLAVASLIVGIVTPLVLGHLTSPQPDWPLVVVFVAALGWYSLVRGWQPQLLRSVCDTYGKPLYRERVLTGQLWLIATWGIVILWRGSEGVEEIHSLGAAILAFLIYQTYVAVS